MNMKKQAWRATISAAAIAASAVTSTFAAPTPENTPDYFVDWVRSRSNLYVDTGVAGKVGVKAEVSFYYIQHDTYPVMLGAWGAEKERFNLVMHENRRCRWEYGHYDSGQFSNPAMTGMDSNGVNVSMDTEYGTLCDVTVECSATGAMSSTWTGSKGNSITATMNASEKYGIIDTKATLFLFAAHRKNGSTDGPSQYAYGILRSCKLWTDYDGTGTWTPARDLRPCVKNGRAGLYDAVTEEILYPQGNELEPGPAKLGDGYSVGSNVHPATQWGRIDYRGKGTRSDGGRDGMGNSQWMHLPLADYTAKGAGDIANLNGGNTSWQGSNLKWSQVRFDGWFQVSSDKAGTWKINQKYDDYFAIFIDGRNVLFNNSYTGEANSTLAVTEGWHRFTIIAGDTYGGYGCNKNYSGLGSIPFSVSVNDGAAMAFNTSNFPQGSGTNVVTLDANADWQSLGPLVLNSGTVLDLNGHQLAVKDIYSDDFFGACITNSAVRKAVLVFTGTPTDSIAYKSGLVREAGTKILFAKYGESSASWTGNGNDGGNALNPNNWQDTLTEEPVLPTAAHAVSIVGSNVNLQIPSGSTFTCKSLEIGNCTLTADCDWSGLPVKPTISGTANLAGHVLTLSNLTVNVGAEFSGGDGSAVAFVVADATNATFGETTFIDNLSSLTMSGSAKILLPKAGSGTFTASTALNIGTVAGETTEFRQTAGTVSLAKCGISTVAGGSAIYAMSNGTLTASSDFEIGGRGVGDFIQTGGTATLASWLNLGRYGGRGTLTVNGGRMVNTLNKEVYVGCVGGTGIVNVGGSGELEVHQLPIGGGWDGNQRGYLNISGNGYVKTRSWVALANHNTSNNRTGYGEVNQSGGTFTVGSDFTVGENNRGTGVYNLTAGALSVSGLLQIGWHDGSTGTFTMSGGTFSTGGDFYVGRDGTGTFNLSGGDMTAGALVRIAWGTGGVGNMTMNGGTFNVNNNNFLVADGGKGTFVQNAGTVTVSKSSSYVCIGNGSTGVGKYTLNGGTLVTPKIKRGAGKGTLILNGGMIIATNVTDGANFISGMNDVTYGPGGLTLDTAGYDVTMATASGANVIASDACTFTKTGNGTVTVNVLPPVGNMVVSNGTLALSATCDNTAPVDIAHRWSFNGNLTDSVSGNTATWAKGSVAYNEGSTAARLTGTAKDTSYIELGPNKVPSDSATFEFWTTIRTRRAWIKLFSLGRDTSNVICFTLNRDSDSGVSGLDVSGTSLLTGTGTLAANTPYYIAFTFAHNADGSTTMKGLCLNATTKAKVGSFERNVTNWSLVDRVDQKYFAIGHSFWNDWDAIADVDEVRVWAGALSDDALALSAQKGPDATAADIAQIAATTTTLPLKRTLELASGATLNLGGNTLTQPVLKGNGTIATGAGGSLVVSDKIVVNVGECIEASGTIDLSNAKIELADPENLATAFTFLKPTAGQTLTVIGVPTPTNLTKRWKVSVSANGTGRIVKRGFVIIVK
jgi:hypothetical protein